MVLGEWVHGQISHEANGSRGELVPRRLCPRRMGPEANGSEAIVLEAIVSEAICPAAGEASHNLLLIEKKKRQVKKDIECKSVPGWLKQENNYRYTQGH